MSKCRPKLIQVQLYVNTNVKTTNLFVVIIIQWKAVCEDSEGCSAEELRVISYNLGFVFLFAVVEIREVRIRTVITSLPQEKIRRTGLL